MTHSLGLMSALLAFLAWGFGDFFIQRSTRKIGSLETLFFNTWLGGLVLLPFAIKDIGAIDSSSLNIVGLATATMLGTALCNFEALRRGKISAIEPVMSTELPMTVGIGVFALRERLTAHQGWLITLVFFGILLTVIRRKAGSTAPRQRLEQGVVLAAAGALFMSLTNIFTGVASQSLSPVAAIGIIDAAIAILLTIWLMTRGRLAATLREGWRVKRITMLQSVVDNAAWLFFAFAVLALPISLTIGITEGYVALASLLGILVNRERFQRHQYVGIIVTLAAVILLAILSP